MGTPNDGQHEVSAEQAVPRSALEQMPRAELFALARGRGVLNTMVMTRDELLEAVAGQQAEQEPRNGHPAPADIVKAAGVRAEEPEPEPAPEPKPAAAPEAVAPAEPEPEPVPRVEPEPETQPEPEPVPQAQAQPEPERIFEPERAPLPRRPTATAPLRSPERPKGISVPGVAAAAVATAVFVWRRKR